LYKILLVTNDSEPYQELVDYFKRDFFNVYVEPIEFIEKNYKELSQYDFMMLHLHEDIQFSIHLISLIKTHAKTPLYLFSKQNDPEFQAEILEYGAEGHLEIPFHPKVVSARIKAVLRFLSNLRQVPVQTVKIGRLVIHMDNREVLFDNRSIQLTNVEFKILKILIEHRDMVVSKDQIIHYVWDEDSSATDNALGIHITRLRKKLTCGQNIRLIETIWGLGYRLNYKACEKYHSTLS